MRIVSKSGDLGGVERELVVVLKDGRNFAYFAPVGANKGQFSGPHFVAHPSIPYGNVVEAVDQIRNMFAEFVCPDFADCEELNELRTALSDLKRSQPSEQELEALREDRVELAFFREEERERAQLKARQAMLDTPRDERPKGF